MKATIEKKKKTLTLKMAIAYKFTPRKCVRYYFPEFNDDTCDVILLERTCYPMCMDTTLTQLYDIYVNK